MTVASAKATLLDVNLCTLHLHLSPVVYTPEPYTDGWENKDSYTFTLGGEKDNFHFDIQCPYDFKTVKVIVPYLNNKVIYRSNRIPSGSMQYEPMLESQYCLDLGYKFIGFHTDSSLDEDSLVTRWPLMITTDTTFYVEAQKMHSVTLIGSDRKNVPSSLAAIAGTGAESAFVSLADRKNFVADGEQLYLPYTLADETPVEYWIAVSGKADLTPLNYSETSNSWKIEPGSPYTITEDMAESIILCAVTARDVALYFHTSIRGKPMRATRNAATAFPCPPAM